MNNRPYSQRCVIEEGGVWVRVYVFICVYVVDADLIAKHISYDVPQANPNMQIKHQ